MPAVPHHGLVVSEAGANPSEAHAGWPLEARGKVRKRWRVPSRTFETVQGQGWRAKKIDGSCREGFEVFEGAIQQIRNLTKSIAGRPRFRHGLWGRCRHGLWRRCGVLGACRHGLKKGVIGAFGAARK